MKNLPLFRGIAVAALPLFLLWRGLGSPFLFDDFPTVLEHPLIRDPSAAWTVWLGHHRAPVYALHAVEYALWGARPAGFRAVNALFHVGTALLLWTALRRLLPGILAGAPDAARQRIAFWTALLFAAHPVSVATAWSVAQRAELMASFFFLAAALPLLLRDRDPSPARLAGAAGLALLSFWSKPTAAGLVLLAAGCAAGRLPSAWRRPLFWGTAALLGILLYTPLMALVRDADPAAYWAAQTRVAWRYAALSMVPTGLRIDHDPNLWGAPPASGLGLAALAAAALAAWRLRKTRPDVALPLAWFLAALAPTALAPLSDFQIDSRAYLAAAAFPFVAARLVFGGIPQRARWMPLVLALLVAGSLSLVERRASRRAAWSDNARHVPKGPRVLANLGEAFRETGELRRAVEAYRGALALDASQPLDAARPGSPSYAPVLSNLGYCLAQTGDTGGAIIAYQKSLEADPGRADSLFNLANLFARRNEHRAAAAHLTVYLDRSPGDPAAVNLLAVSLARTGQLDAALGWWRYLLTLRPGDARVLNNLGNALLAAGDGEEAARCYEAAVQAEPDPSERAASLRNLLRAHLAAGRAEDAETAKRRLSEIPGADAAPPDEPIWR